ncbi:hypothetical protein [Lewinella sp. JB7]|uniref:hypothetical protein n=1 Tax=Lewinella sp. JB7 TaxID=2962887 RepID=UPI0020C93DDC|nr:hypothetical protein [Lewinella sp. JB7]MCP9234524.1 hypothetical protein [Lewinella sp. JB7]
MKLLGFFLACWPFLLHAQADTTQYPFVAYWSVGDTYNFEVAKIKLDYRNDTLTKADTMRYRSTFEVLEENDSSYLIRYYFGTDMEMTQVIPPPITEMLSAYDLSSITYRTNEVGAFQRLENWETFADAMQATFDAMTADALKSPGMDSALFRSIMDPLAATYTTEAGILNKLVDELQHLHFFYGYSYGRYDTLRYSNHFQNMYGGPPFPVQSTLLVEEADWSEDYVVMRHYNQVTPEANDIFIQSMRLAYPALVEKDPDGFDQLSYDVYDDNWYAFYYNPGIPIKIENDRWITVVAEGSKNVKQERLIVTWVD